MSLWGHFWGHFQNRENVLPAPGDQLYNTRISHKDSHQKCILREPYAVNPRAPPIFIDFLPTNSSRQNPTPADIWVVRQVRSGRSGLGGQGLGLGLGGLGLGG